jgi:hypothetical protein
MALPAAPAAELLVSPATPATPPTVAIQAQVDAAAPGLAVTGVRVNDGSLQRSTVTSLTIEFSEEVSFPFGERNAFSLVAIGPAGPQAIDFRAGHNGNAVVLRFANEREGRREASLPDGRYRLTVHAQNVRSLAGAMTEDFQTPLSGPGSICCLFGDADGDGDVDAADYAAFRAAFGTTSAVFDADADGDVDAIDFTEFRARLGTALPSAGDPDSDGDFDAVDQRNFRLNFGTAGPSLSDFDGDVDAVDFGLMRQRLAAAQPPPLVAVSRTPGDTDGDGDVDVIDARNFRLDFGTIGPSLSDLDGDGDVDAADFILFRQRFGTGA